MIEKTAHLPLPDLSLTDGTPISAAFGDVYFSRDGGIAETTHVFLRGNRLPQRWQSQAQFTIGELGFGTGLNFLTTWREFLATTQRSHLHYIAVEKYPLNPAMLRDVLALQPPLKPFAERLIANYPLRLPGFHRIHLERATLTLYYGDVAEFLSELTTTIDAWFLDGFSPAKNADMWRDEMFAALAQRSAPGATLATFTAAGAVKRGLQAQGFTVTKTPGYGHKRDMLVGELLPPTGGGREGGHASSAGANNAPTLTLPRWEREQALIIGGGIAGCTTARALAERGMQVTLLEQNTIASAASGNAAAVLFPQLTKRWNRSAAWYFAAYDFMLQQLRRWNVAHHRTGMLRLPRHADEETQLRMLNTTLGLDPEIVHWIDQNDTEKIAGIALPTGAAFFPGGTWIEPKKLCHALLQHPNITLHEHGAVAALANQAGQWIARSNHGTEYAAEYCILAAAHATQQLLPQHHLPLGKVAGQISEIAATETTKKLRSILCQKGYLIPGRESVLIGATYDHHDFSCTVTPENHQRNLAEASGAISGIVTSSITGGRTSLRATTPDRLPYIGMLEKGLYVSTGHGSRGMLSAPLAAEMIASAITQEQSPVTQSLRDAVYPVRASVRANPSRAKIGA